MNRLIAPLKYPPKTLQWKQCVSTLRVNTFSTDTADNSNQEKKEKQSDETSPGENFANYQFQQQLNEIKIREVNDDVRFSNFRGFSLPPVKPSRLKQVVLKDKTRRVLKTGSFIRTLFAPDEDGIDTDYLYFPEILKSRHQFKALEKQQQVIEKYFASSVLGRGQAFDNEDVIRRLFDQGYASLWTLTRVEMMNIIESIGSAIATKVIDLDSPISDVAATSLDLEPTEGKAISTKKQVDLEPLKVDQFWLPKDTLLKSDAQLKSYADHALVNQDELSTIIKLLSTQIALSVIDNSPNQRARSLIYDELNQNPHLKIAFAFTEPDLKAGQLPCYDFATTANLTSDKSFWLLNGVKDNILADDYDYYLVFASNTQYPDSALRPEYLKSQPIPFPGLVALLVKRSEIAQMRQYTKNNMNYLQVRIDDLLVNRGDREICESVVDGVQAMNAKGLLQLAYSSLILGQMKSLVSECSKFLIDKKTPLVSSQYMASLFYQANIAVYKLESLLYFSTSLHDGLYKKGYPELCLECAITAVSAVKLALECTRAVRKIGGIEVWHKIGPIEDVIVLLGNLVEDNNFSQAQVAMYGIDFVAERSGRSPLSVAKMPLSPHNSIDHPFKPVLKYWALSRRNYLLSPSRFVTDWDLQGYVHPSLGREANFLEQSIRIASYSACLVYANHSGELDRLRNNFTFQLYPVYDQVADVYTNITCMARASRAYSETLRNSDVDMFYCRYLSYETLNAIIERLEKLEWDILDRYKACINVNLEWASKNPDDAWYLTPAWDNMTLETRKELLEPPSIPLGSMRYKRID